MKDLYRKTPLFSKSSLLMSMVLALGSISLTACSPNESDMNVSDGLDKNAFIERVSEQGIFEQWDINDDNQLTENEWSQHDDYNLIYESWDQNGDGQLSENEFHEGLYTHYDKNNSDLIEEKEWNKAESDGWMNV